MLAMIRTQAFTLEISLITRVYYLRKGWIVSLMRPNTGLEDQATDLSEWKVV